MNPFVFLDINGVLITHGPERVHRHRGQDLFSSLSDMADMRCVGRLVRFCNRNSARPVLSSTWRKDGNWTQVEAFLRSHGLKTTFAGRTASGAKRDPRVFDAITGRMPRPREPWPRGYEVFQYVQEIDGAPFVIFDDDDDMQPLAQHHVRTTPSRGITAKDVSKAEAILARP